MVKHIVMWKLHEEAAGKSKSENISIVISKLNGLKAVIDEILSLEVGENFNTSDAAFDLVLTTTHQDRSGLEAYVKHPAHQEVASFIGSVVAERRVVDYEL